MTNPDQPTLPAQSAAEPLQETMPMRGVPLAAPTVPAQPAQRPAATPYVPPALPPHPAPRPRALPPRRAGLPRRWGLWLLAAGSAFGVVVLIMLSVGVAAVSANVLPGVSVGGLRVGGLSLEQATRLIAEQSHRVTLTAHGQTWRVPAAELGLAVDVRASAQRAFNAGRSDGDFWQALLGRVSIPLVVTFDVPTAEAYLLANQDSFSVPPVDASVAFVDGDVQALPAQEGRALDVQGTLAVIVTNPAAALEAPLALVTQPVLPQVLDVTPALNAARALLSSPLELRVYDPVTDASITWSAPPQQWGQWLTAVSDPASPIGLRLALAEAPLIDFLTAQAAVFDASRTIDVPQAVAEVQAALAQGDPRRATIQVKHLPRQYRVQAGETLTSIAWNVGIPYPYIQQANGGRDRFSAGEVITLPPADSFLLFPPIPHKRIVVSISRQRVWVYENGQLLHEWVASTGINDSPTWPGIYQVILRERNAYAGNWDLWMPYFVGVYRPIPGADFTNGFHGFPTRGGGQILWENSLGRRVTYGCILINNQNAAWLFNWAEEGVVVEIQG
jgi:lipoprotein-anchoring transpeptidase ErfK/SrfK